LAYWGLEIKFDLVIEEALIPNGYETREKTSGKKLRQKTYDTVPQVFLLFDAVNRLEGDLR